MVIILSLLLLSHSHSLGHSYSYSLGQSCLQATSSYLVTAVCSPPNTGSITLRIFKLIVDIQINSGLRSGVGSSERPVKCRKQ